MSGLDLVRSPSGTESQFYIANYAQGVEKVVDFTNARTEETAVLQILIFWYFSDNVFLGGKDSDNI